MADSAATLPAGPLPEFHPAPYGADGGFTPSGAVMVAVALGAAGLVMGVLASIISQYFYLIVLFPLAIGFVIGTAGSKAVQWGKIRQPWVCGAVGFLAGCLSMLAMHYNDYLRFEANLAEVPAPIRELARNLEQLKAPGNNAPQEIREVIDEMNKNPDVLEVLKVDSFAGYMQLMARRGVELSRAGNRGGMNLGYVGSFIYWVAESLLVAWVAFSMMRGSANEPYCSTCNTWKESRFLGGFEGQSEQAHEALVRGALRDLASQRPSAEGGETIITAFSCPNCGDQSPVDYRLEKCTFNKKGELQKKQLAQITYPGQSLPAFQALFAAPPDSPPIEEDKAIVS